MEGGSESIRYEIINKQCYKKTRKNFKGENLWSYVSES